MIALRRRTLPLANRWYSGVPDAHGLRDLGWLRADGQPLAGDDWRNPSARTLAVLIGAPGKVAAPLLLLVNAESPTSAAFALPGGDWQVLLDTAGPTTHRPGAVEATYPLAAYGLALLSRTSTATP